MIRKLQKKVFWSILLSAAGVLFVLLVVWNSVQYIRTTQKYESTLDSADETLFSTEAEDHGHGHGENENKDGSAVNIIKGKGKGKGKSGLFRSLSAGEFGMFELDADGTVLSSEGLDGMIEDSTLQALIRAAEASKEGKGKNGSWICALKETENARLLFVLNISSYQQEIRQTLLLSAGGFLLAVLLFILLARWISHKIVKPVEESLMAQKRFAADASHELKTPLAVIEANAAVLEKNIGENQWLNYIQTESVKMADLVAALLELSELDQMQDDASLPGSICSFDAVETVLETVLPFESVAFEHQLTLNTDLPDHFPIEGNPADLARITGILLDNAIKHSDSGSTVEIRLVETETRKKLHDVRQLELHLTNTGPEIPEEALPHIFERFYKADPSRNRSDNSYGLGLAIASALAEKNKGTLFVASKDRKTEFVLTLPV